MQAAENYGTQAATFFFDRSHQCDYEAQRLRKHSSFVRGFPTFLWLVSQYVINNVEMERQTLSWIRRSRSGT